ncbi:hypothetical protein ACI6Q2_22700 [Chitinophagaceae bacterium LWZ2-11]
MKKNLLAIALLIGLAGFSFTESKAQVSVGININIGTQPLWGPTGYDYVNYYYLPDIDAYYNVPQRQFIYMSGGRWTFASALPSQYGSYDLYRSYKVVVNEPKPYLHADVYRNKYMSYRGRYDKQVVIKNSNDPKYFVVKGHPRYDERNVARRDNGDRNHHDDDREHDRDRH